MTAPTTFVLFGATGDLAKRKLIPGLLHLFQSRLVDDLRVIGTSLDELTPDAFRDLALVAIREHSTREMGDADWHEFAQRLDFVPLSAGPLALGEAVARAEELLPGESTSGCTTCRCRRRPRSPRCAPSLEAGLVERSRVVMEKPFGTDYASAVALNAQLHEVFDEEQIFRIDHFLGKEAAQNILAFRFANGLFEPIWHRNNISHIEIDVPETLGLPSAATSTRPPAPTATWSSPTCSRSSRSPRWSPRRRSSRPRSAGEEQGLPLDAADQAPTSCAGSTPATTTSPACSPTPRPRPSSP